MPDFDKLEQEAQQEAKDHSQQVDEGVSKAEQQVDQRAGQDHDSQVQEAGTALEKELGTQDQQPQK